jgi:hypothetical protein
MPAPMMMMFNDNLLLLLRLLGGACAVLSGTVIVAVSVAILGMSIKSSAIPRCLEKSHVSMVIAVHHQRIFNCSMLLLSMKA